MDSIRWGIIGCGNVTEVKSGPGFQKARGSSLVAVMRRSGALAQDYARRHGVPRWTDQAEVLVRDPEVDAVYIATPPSSHKEYTLMAAAAGKPVYVEKPMGLNSAECQAMRAACQAAGVPLFVAYYRRALPRFLKIKELIDQGAIGKARFVQITLSQRPPDAAVPAGELPWRVRPEIAGGGHFVDLAAHTLDLLDFYFGPVVSAAGFSQNQGGFYPAEDIVSSSFVFASGVQGAGIWSFTNFEALDQVVISGSEGKITFGTFNDDPVTLTTPAGQTRFQIEHPAHIQQPLIQQVVDQLRGIGTCVSTGESGARTTWVMEQMLMKPQTMEKIK